MLLVGKCEKCGETVKLDIQDKSLEEVKEMLGDWKEFQCPGHHLELCSPYPRFWNVDDWSLEDGSAPTEEEFLFDLIERYEEVIDTQEMNKRKIVVGFSCGMPITNDGHNWNYKRSPKGKRYYYR